jgi:hypothetical protein
MTGVMRLELMQERVEAWIKAQTTQKVNAKN